MRLFVVSWDEQEVPRAIVAAAERIGLEAVALTPPQTARRAKPGDLVLSYLDIRPMLDGVEPGAALMRGLARRGVSVLNPPEALLACHDKLVTALRLGRAGLPHPDTAYLSAASRAEDVSRLRFPAVVKPRFGTRGAEVVACAEPAQLAALLERLRRRAWFRRHGALLQQLVPPAGHDLRVLVAGGQAVGAARRVAATGEWRTNVALGAIRLPAQPPSGALELAVEAAAAVGADLAGVDLIPRLDGSLAVLEVNGAPEFTRDYSLGDRDVFEAAVLALLFPARRRLRAAGGPSVSIEPAAEREPVG
jgi:[lysine-biosynthesis-protein LysW]---L-2-aminoadipate ligase